MKSGGETLHRKPSPIAGLVLASAIGLSACTHPQAGAAPTSEPACSIEVEPAPMVGRDLSVTVQANNIGEGRVVSGSLTMGEDQWGSPTVDGSVLRFGPHGVTQAGRVIVAALVSVDVGRTMPNIMLACQKTLTIA